MLNVSLFRICKTDRTTLSKITYKENKIIWGPIFLIIVAREPFVHDVLTRACMLPSRLTRDHGRTSTNIRVWGNVYCVDRKSANNLA